MCYITNGAKLGLRSTRRPYLLLLLMFLWAIRHSAISTRADASAHCSHAADVCACYAPLIDSCASARRALDGEVEDDEWRQTRLLTRAHWPDRAHLPSKGARVKTFECWVTRRNLLWKTDQLATGKCSYSPSTNPLQSNYDSHLYVRNKAILS